MAGSNGYNLTVKLFVNGQEVKSTGKLRLKTGENGCLNFTPRRGYYYHMPNGYDITSGSWVASTGYLFIPALDREDDNALSIYLWTFNNHTNLDVERRPGDASSLEGYLISYDALDPQTGETKTYAYQATSFLLAQSQIVPTGTPITITGVCPPGKEVTEWSHGYQVNGITLTSDTDENPNDTVAPGNRVKLTVENTELTSITIYAEGLGPAHTPTPEEVAELVGKNGVKVDCTTRLHD